jgi:hypothetical protein
MYGGEGLGRTIQLLAPDTKPEVMTLNDGHLIDLWVNFRRTWARKRKRREAVCNFARSLRGTVIAMLDSPG